MTFAARFIGWITSLGNQTQRSLRLRRAAIAYLSRAFVNGSATQWTHHQLFKRGTIDAYDPIFGTSLAGGEGAYFHSDSTLVVTINGAVMLKSNRLFRDPTAHMDIVMVSDMGHATAALKFRVYVNNEEITSWSTDTRSSYSSWTYWNRSAASHYIGYSNALGAYSDSYRSRVIHVDGQVLTPGSFSQYGSNGNWQPKEYAGTYGTTGFQLRFDDPTSTTTLCSDSSGNGNNWTASNISLTAGSTYDSMLDVPLGGGGNERGNYATLNPIYAQAVSVGISNANLSVTLGSALNRGAVGTIFVPSGKWYWEVIAAGSSAIDEYGVISAGGAFNAGSVTQGAVYLNDGRKIVDGAAASTYGAAFTTGDIIGVALDNDSGSITFYKNNVSQGAITLAVREYAAAITDGSGTGSGPHHINFGQRPFSYAPPTGFKALHTGNLTNTTPLTSGSFTGNLRADGPFIWCNGTPETLTINGNAVTWGTHADKLANGFKIRTASSSYNSSGTNNWTATYLSPSSKSAFKYQNAKGNP